MSESAPGAFASAGPADAGARCREFVREPEAVFWAVVFPGDPAAAGLGVAFRNQPAEVAQDRRDVRRARRRRSAGDPQLSRSSCSAPSRRRRRCATGKVALVVEPAPDGGVSYRYDDTNPEARTARAAGRPRRAAWPADASIRCRSGRARARAGLALHRLPDARPGRHGHHGQRRLGPGLLDRRRAPPQADEAARRRRRCRGRTTCCRSWSGAWLLLVVEVGVPVGFGVVAFGVPVRGSLLELAAICVAGIAVRSARSGSWSPRGRGRSRRVSGLMNVVMMPMWILSGVFFSAQRFPDVVQPFIKALPLTALIDALRANMLQGAGLRAARAAARRAGRSGSWSPSCWR